MYSSKSLQRQELSRNKSHLAAVAIWHSLTPRTTPGTGQVLNTYLLSRRLKLVSSITNLVPKLASLSSATKNPEWYQLIRGMQEHLLPDKPAQLVSLKAERRNALSGKDR